MLSRVVIEARETEQSDETLKSSHTPFGDEVVKALPHLPSPYPVPAPRKAPGVGDKLNHSRPRSRKLSFLFLLTAAVPLFATLMMWSVCTVARSRHQAAGNAHRRLSDFGRDMDSEEHSIVDDCLALEAELGILHPGVGPTPYEDRSRRIAELVSLLSEAAAEYESRQSRQSMLGMDYSSGGFPHGVQARTDGYSGIFQSPVESGGGQQMMLDTPDALLTCEGGYASRNAPEMEPDTWTLEHADDTDHIERERYHLTQQTDSVPRDGEVSWIASLTAANQSSDGVERRASHPDDLRNHPYVRLPVLEAGVVPRGFNPTAVFGTPRNTIPIVDILLDFRQLFARQTLNQQDTDLLVGLVMKLANNIWLKASATARQFTPLFATVSLGSTFLAMDYLVAAVEVLGDHMKPHVWWEGFANAVDTDYALPEPSQYCRSTTRFNTEVGNQLLEALKIYKERRRPPIGDVIGLKVTLFFSQYAPPLFQDSQWDPWREDQYSFAKCIFPSYSRS
ncbi:hypothetical protein, conserved [Eimeria praecox]|uniref:Transmembrane protein n=1 Tax=Eimeria praecox TaxID=51316 RepID=U6H245_9EIME|nr:hypothetical protein, conserved [Eimeria praecox]